MKPGNVLLTAVGQLRADALSGPLAPMMKRARMPDWRGAAFMKVDFAGPGRTRRFQDAWGLDAQDCNAAIPRDARWKYVHFNGGMPPVLFDLAGDPELASETARMAQKMFDQPMTRCNRRLARYSIGT